MARAKPDKRRAGRIEAGLHGSALIVHSDKIAARRTQNTPHPEAALATLANALTLLRILALPAVVVLVLEADGPSITATIVFMAAACTDFFDGLVARKTGTVTGFGKMLDPFADRLFISGTIIALAMAGLVPVVGVVLVAGRDVFMILGYKLMQMRGVTPRVSLLGKAYTALFMVAIVAAMSGAAPGGVRLGWWLFWVGVAGSMITGVGYTVSGVRRMRQAGGIAND